MRKLGRYFCVAAALLLSVHALAGNAYAQFEAPEVDPGSIAAGLALLAGGALLLRARRRSR